MELVSIENILWKVVIITSFSRVEWRVADTSFTPDNRELYN